MLDLPIAAPVRVCGASRVATSGSASVSPTPNNVARDKLEIAVAVENSAAFSTRCLPLKSSIAMPCIWV